MTDKLNAIADKLTPFTECSTPDDFPDYMNVLGTYLLIKYKAMRQELLDYGKCVPIKSGSVPFAELPTLYRNLTIYSESIIMITRMNILKELDEIVTMLNECIHPRAVRSLDMLEEA